jgi:protease I
MWLISAVMMPVMMPLSCNYFNHPGDSVMSKTVAMLVTNGFDQLELTDAKRIFEDTGVTVVLVSPESGTVRAWNNTDWGDEFAVDVSLDHAQADDYDALMLHGGIVNPELVRGNEKLHKFVRHFFDAKKPVGAVYHSPWTWQANDLVGSNDKISYYSF